jgi:hypothetical protein
MPTRYIPVRKYRPPRSSGKEGKYESDDEDLNDEELQEESERKYKSSRERPFRF